MRMSNINEFLMARNRFFDSSPTTISVRIGRMRKKEINLFDQGTIGSVIERLRETHADHPAIVFPGSSALTYSDLFALIQRIVGQLRSFGLGPSARIAVSLPSGPLGALATVAVSCAAVAIPINPKRSLEELESCFDALMPDAIVLLQGDDSAARLAAQTRGVYIFDALPIDGGILEIPALAKSRGPVPQTRTPAPDQSAFILQTSGTTAKPKFIPFTHRNMVAAAPQRVQGSPYFDSIACPGLQRAISANPDCDFGVEACGRYSHSLGG